jgi:hypothetical protein
MSNVRDDKRGRKAVAAKTVGEAARRVAAVLDDCTHPECVQDRKERGYSCCAGGYLARKTVNAIYGRPEDA